MIPPLTAIRDAALLGVYTFVMAFLAGLLGRGIDVEHLATVKDAALAAITAVLAALGYAGARANVHLTPSTPRRGTNGGGA